MAYFCIYIILQHPPLIWTYRQTKIFQLLSSVDWLHVIRSVICYLQCSPSLFCLQYLPLAYLHSQSIGFSISYCMCVTPLHSYAKSVRVHVFYLSCLLLYLFIFFILLVGLLKISIYVYRGCRFKYRPTSGTLRPLNNYGPAQL